MHAKNKWMFERKKKAKRSDVIVKGKQKGSERRFISLRCSLSSLGACLESQMPTLYFIQSILIQIKNDDND